jgi:hydroxypyruvate reductase
MDKRSLTQDIWQAGVDAVSGYAATKSALTDLRKPDQIVAVGKAASDMARAALDAFGALPCLVVTKDGHGGALPDHVQVFEASHPVPDTRSLHAGRQLRETVSAMGPGRHLLLLVSGGASSLAEDLVDGATLDDLAALNTRLLSEGLDITAMNAQRRTLSRIKGGGLLSGFKGAKATVLAISDVPGDDVAVVGSGIGLARDDIPHDTRVIASNASARAAAAAKAQDLVLPVHENAQSLHDDLFTLADQIGPKLRTMPRGVIILGGEPTVTLPPNPGQGGRNQALALALSQHIAGIDDLAILVGGTDGTDGPTDAAGGLVDGTTWSPGAEKFLQAADAGSYLATKGDLIKTGPTGTNVMDLLVALRT